MESSKKIGDIYTQKIVDDYYKTVGECVVEGTGDNPDTLLNALIPKDLSGKTVLDLACGNGRHSEIFCERGADKVVAVDLSKSMLEQAKARKDEKQLRQLELVQADMDDLPVGEDKFNFVFSRFGLMYSAKMEQLVENIGRSLSDNEEILAEINVAEISDQANQSAIRRQAVPLTLAIGDKKVTLENFAYTIEEYTNAFEKAGLNITIIKQFPADNISINHEFSYSDAVRFYYYVIKAKKKHD